MQTTKSNLKSRIISALLFLAIFVSLIPPFTFEGLAAGIDKESTDAQFVGYGYDVTRGELKKSNLSDTKPILDLSSDIYDYVFVKDINESTAENLIAYSAQELSEQVGDIYSGGIKGTISAVSLDISGSFDKSQQSKTAIAERYELYYYNIIRKTMVIQLDVSELREYLSDSFRRELLAVQNEEQAIQLLTKYGTHLITGYNLGGRMEVTNYQTKSSLNTSWAYNVSLSEQLGVASTAAKAGQSFSLSQMYTQGYNSSTESASYSFRTLGGMSVEGFTLDQLFTYNSSIVDGKGNYIYGRWIYSVNDGENLDIVGISAGGQAVPLWELLPVGSEYNMIRSYLISAYVTKCGDKYDEYCNTYKPLYANIADENEERDGNIDITGYYGITGGVVSSVTFDSATTKSEVVPGTTVIMAYDDTTEIYENVEWSITEGGSYAIMEDAKNGIFNVKADANGKTIKIVAKVDGAEKAEWSFEVKNNTYTAGKGVNTDDEYDPYIISTAEDLRQLTLNPSDWSKDFVLANNIDLSKFDVDTWNTIGNSSTPFSGTFDGNYCSVKGLTRQSGDLENIGLFGIVEGTVKNLILDNPDIVIDKSLTDIYAGALVDKNSGNISNCIVKNPTVKITYVYNENDGLGDKKGVNVYVGGLVGKNNGTISECGVVNPRISAAVNVKDTKANDGKYPQVKINCVSGGMVGFADGGNYSYCYVQTITSGTDVSEISSFTEGEKHVTSDGFFGMGKEYGSNTCSNNYSGGMIGYASSVTLNECIIDIPNVILAQRKNCYGTESSYVAGTLIGKVDGENSYTNTFTHSVRQAATSTDAEVKSAETRNGDGAGTIPNTTGKHKVIEGEILLSNGNINNSIGSKSGKWCADKTTGFPILKSFAIQQLSLDTTSVKTEYYYNQGFTMEGLNVSIVPSYGEAEPIEIKTYKIDYSSFNKEKISVSGYGISVQLGNYSNSYKVYVKKCDIEYFIAKDVSTEKVYLGEEYTANNRNIELTAFLSNGEQINPITNNSLSYVNYPGAPFTLDVEDFVLGANKVTVNYAGKSYQYAVNCIDNKVLKIELVSPAQKTEYIVGETFSTAGMKVKATYESGAVKIVDNKDLELMGVAVALGENDVIVSYDAYVTLREPIKITGYSPISVTSLPDKTEYYVGEDIDFSGFVLSYTLNGEVFEEITADKCDFSTTQITSVGDNVIAVTYKSFTEIFILTGKKHDEKFVVTWKTDSWEYQETYTCGDVPVFKGSTDKAPDNVYSYSFVGWDKPIEAVTADITYTALYDSQYILYTVRFNDINGNAISTTQYRYGDTVSIPDAPEVEGMVFNGWAPIVTTVTQNATYTPMYSPEISTPDERFTVTWQTSSSIYQEIYLKGDLPVFKGSTDKASDNVYSYSFAGWDKPIEAVTADITYTALYDSQYILYTVRFNDINGNAISTTQYRYGDTVSIPDAPEVEGMVFNGWAPIVTTVTQNATYTPMYTQNVQPPSTDNNTSINAADVNGDSEITYEDAVLLLRYIHFPSTNKIQAGTGDVNGDGKITSDDAIYLKNHLYNSSHFPIN